MKNKIYLTLAFAIFKSLSAQTTYLPSNPSSSGSAFVGINISSAPTSALEVGGGIGINYGSSIGVRDANITSTNRKILQTGWNSNSGGFDFISFFTPGNSNSTNANEKMTITGTGKISMGLSISNGQLPEAKLHVHQDEALGTAQFSNLVLTRTSGNYGSAGSRIAHSTWLIRHTAGSAWNTVYYKDGLSVDGSFLNPQSDVKTWWDRDPYSDNQAWGTNAQTYMSINQGKVGVNIDLSTSPIADRGKLQVEETNGGVKAFVVKTTHLTPNGHTAGYGYCIVADVNDDRTHSLKVIQRNFFGTNQPNETFSVYGDGQTIISSKNATPFMIQDASTSGGPVNFKIQKNGQTAIGCSNPGSFMLAVEGKIGAREIKVTLQNPWPDYVFGKNYALLSLIQVEDYINKNKHLPNVPSADDLQKDKEGLDLGKMQTIQMQKIEELFLYVIELKKENKALSQKIDQLKASK